MEKNEFIILVDMDDVLENLQEAWVRRLNEKYNEKVDIHSVDNWNIGLFYPKLTREQVLSPLVEDNFWRTVNPKTDAIEYLKKLYEEGFQIFVITSSHYLTLKNKLEQALWPYFPYIDEDHIIICNNKQLIKGNVLVDDGVHNLVDLHIAKADYFKILFTANYNKNYNSAEYDMCRVTNWAEVYTNIERLFVFKNELERMSGEEEKTP